MYTKQFYILLINSIQISVKLIRMCLDHCATYSCNVYIGNKADIAGIYVLYVVDDIAGINESMIYFNRMCFLFNFVSSF